MSDHENRILDHESDSIIPFYKQPSVLLLLHEL